MHNYNNVLLYRKLFPKAYIAFYSIYMYNKFQFLRYFKLNATYKSALHTGTCIIEIFQFRYRYSQLNI